MKKDWKYLLYLSVAIGLFITVKLLSPRQHNWTITYAHDDRNPYGGYALNEVLPSLFEKHTIRHSYQTLYEIKDSLKLAGSILIVCTDFKGHREDAHALLKHVEVGGSAFISAEEFWGDFADTLKLATVDHLFKNGTTVFAQEDTTSIHFINTSLDTSAHYYFSRGNIRNYFNEFDTTRTTVLAVNEDGKPVTIRVKWGQGNLILNSTPLAFTNIYLLSRNNHEYISTMLSCLPEDDVEWTEYYQLGRMESGTPLRFILSDESLRWAYYILVLSLLAFMIFEMKRKQRIIPVLPSLTNTSLEFIGTIGNLYYQNGDHKNAALKKINFLFDHIRAKFWLSTTRLNDDFVQALSAKSGIAINEVTELVATILRVQSKAQISGDELIDLNEKLEKFYNTSARG